MIERHSSPQKKRPGTDLVNIRVIPSGIRYTSLQDPFVQGRLHVLPPEMLIQELNKRTKIPAGLRSVTNIQAERLRKGITIAPATEPGEILVTERREEPKAQGQHVSRLRGRIRRRLGAIGLASLGFGGITIADAGCNSGGDITSITVAGHQVPSDFVSAISDASKVCNAITPQILAGLTMKETTFNAWDQNPNQVSSAGAKGPTQWLPKYWNNAWGNIMDVHDAEMATAHRLCNGAKTTDVWSAVENYNPGDPNYASAVQNWANQTTVNYGSSGSGSNSGSKPSKNQGSGGDSQQKNAPKPHDLNGCYKGGFSGDVICKIGHTSWYYDKTTHQVSQ